MINEDKLQEAVMNYLMGCTMSGLVQHAGDAVYSNLLDSTEQEIQDFVDTYLVTNREVH